MQIMGSKNLKRRKRSFISRQVAKVLKDSEYLGVLDSGEQLDLSRSLPEFEDTYYRPPHAGFWFTVEDPEGIDLFLGLGDLKTDLDIYISRTSDIRVDGDHLVRENSSKRGTEDETIFAKLPEGDYYVWVKSNQKSKIDSNESSFSLAIDTQAFSKQTVLPNDEYFSYQWYLFSSPFFNFGGGRDELSPKNILSLNNADIRAPEAWKIQNDASDIVVAVIDTGVDYTHPDLSSNIWVNSGEVPGNGVDDDGNGYIDDVRGWDFSDNDNDPMDAHFHGTHVAGTIGASGDNGIGISGVAWNTQLMPIRVLGPNGGSDEDIINGILYAIDNGADIINLSLGGNEKYSADEFLYSNRASAFYDVFEYALEKDVFIAIAAGNDGDIYGDLQNWKGVGDMDTYTGAPAVFSQVFDNIVSVASTESLVELSPFSNYGQALTIAAPGGDTSKSYTIDVDPFGTPIKAVTKLFGILSTTPAGKGDPQFDGLYDFENGTSMATPVVAGAAALIRSLDPSLSAIDVRRILEQSASYNPSLKGKVNQARSLDLQSALELTLNWKRDPITGSGSIVGTEFGDLIIGDYTDNTIDGSAGNDRLFGGSGQDTFLLSAGSDRVEDYELNDRFVVDGTNLSLSQISSGVLIGYDSGETLVVGASVVDVVSSLLLT